MEALGSHALLALALAGVAVTGWRTAGLAVPGGLVRVVAAATLGVAAIVVQALALGAFGLLDARGLVALLAVVVGGASYLLVPARGASAAAQARAAWDAAPLPVRCAAGALVALLLGWIAWQLAHPYVSDDGETYHLPLAASWAQNGHPGSLVGAIDGVPVASYPVTNEVILSWWLSLSHSWVAASVWNPLVAALMVAAAWLGLRELRVPRVATGLAAVAWLVLPLAATQLGGPLTDLPCAAWLVVCAALCACARERPALLGVAIVAAGLSFGTKTTGSVLLALSLGYALWTSRGVLRAHVRALVGGVVLGIAVGGVWVLRNTVDHGSPLWPFASGPFGDAIPRAFEPFNGAFLDHPRAMLDGRTQLYLDNLSGGTLLLVAAIVAPLLVRTRAALVAGGVTLLAVIVWGRAPYTGITSDTSLAVGSIRYLLPALAAACLALAIVARDASTSGRRAVYAVLAISALGSAGRTFGDLGFPYVPSIATVVLLLVLGAGAGWVAARLPRRALTAVPAALLVVMVVVLAHGSNGYVRRHTDSGRFDQGILRAALKDPAWRDGRFTIAMGPSTAALLRGDHLQHRVRFVPASAPCVKARWLVVQIAPPTAQARALRRRCARGKAVLFRNENYVLYG